MALSLVGLGSNLGDRQACLRLAVTRLASLPSTSQVAESRCIPSVSIGGPAGQPEFLNAAALLETALAPSELLAALHTIEDDLGRKRAERWGPRSIDLDLLLYDDEILEAPDLTVPHPRMAFRRFVLAPAVEIAPDMVHPEIGWTVRQLWEHLNSAPNYVALDGGTPEFRYELSDRVALDAPAKAFHLSPEHGRRPPGKLRDRLPAVGSLAPAEAAISDFWLDSVEASLENPRLAKVKSEWEVDLRWLRSHALAPKLLVRLEKSLPQIPFRGPVLKLETRGLAEAAAEIVAAIHAMR